ncbi:MAG TPA: ACT domain-containing protein, partial [Piscirickettsiaceae bacterium]|nr:ACT domain-containing protein [Piscirickettsiaceae bacterium]
ADVLSTSPEVWNDWKNALFLELYNETSRMLDQALETPKDVAKKSLKHQEKARELLQKAGIPPERFAPLWDALSSTEFFYRQVPQAIARITQQLLDADLPVVRCNDQPIRGASEILIYTEDRDFLFAQITRTLEKAQVSIMEAQIYCLPNGNTLTLFYGLERQQHSPLKSQHCREVVAQLQVALHTPIDPQLLETGRPDRKLRCFITPTEIAFHPRGTQTELFLSTLDVPGLLAKVARVFVENGVRIHDAKISTVGEKVEDTFLISTRDNQPLDQKHQNNLRTSLIEALSCDHE